MNPPEPPRMAGAAQYLTPNEKIGGDLKLTLAGVSPLPNIVSLPRLLAAAEKLPAAPFALLMRVAQLAPATSVNNNALLWHLYEKMPGTSERARLRAAGKLAELFEELDDALPLNCAKNPFAAFPGASEEKKFAEKTWRAMSKDAPHLLRRKGALLAALADKIKVPLNAVIDEETTPLERDFYRHCGARILPQRAAPLESFLERTLSADIPLAAATYLPDYCEGCGDSPTDAANLALLAIRRFLAAGRSVGVVVYDRLLARRLRVVAEEDGLLIKDNVGWRAETLSIGAALRAFAAVGDEGFSPAAALEWLSPPFFAAEPNRQKAESRWRERLMQTSPEALTLPETLDEWQAQAAPELTPIAAGLAAAKQRAPHRATPRVWLNWLRAESADMLAAWQNDALAADLFARLEHRAAPENSLSNKEFLLWLEDNLAAENCPESDIDSPVEFVSPATRRQFSAVVLLGYADNRESREGWLSHAERRAMEKSLNIRERERGLYRQRRRRFCQLVAAHTRVAAIWGKISGNGEECRPNPFWRALTQLCKNGEVEKLSLPQNSWAADDNRPPPAAAKMRHWPPALHITAAEQLIKCPYAFYATTLLKLKDDEIPRAGDAPPALTGKLLHQALGEFSDSTAEITEAAQLDKAWRGIIDKTLAGNRPELKLLAAYWRANADKFIAWETKRRQEGWKTLATECGIKTTWQTRATARSVNISGRIDRVDTDSDGQAEIIDYKSGALPAKKEMDAGEKPQLSLYAYLYQQLRGVRAARQFLCKPLGAGASETTVKETENGANPAQIAARLRAALHRIDEGEEMPANGARESCEKCAAAGVCRREHWRQPGDNTV